MYAFSTRLVCSLIVLAGFFGEQGASVETAPGPVAGAWIAPALSVTPEPTATANPPDSTGADVPRAVITSDPPPPAGATNVVLRRVYRVTAYCDRGTTAAGVPSGVGQCAAPADIPFGAEIYIPALDRTFIVTDRTAKRFRFNTVDLFIPSKTQCKRFGRRYLECEITLPAVTPHYGSKRLLHQARRVAR